MEIADIVRVLIAKRMKDEVLTGPEEKQLEDWLNASSENQKLYDSFINPLSFKALLKEYHPPMQKIIPYLPHAEDNMKFICQTVQLPG